MYSVTNIVYIVGCHSRIYIQALLLYIYHYRLLDLKMNYALPSTLEVLVSQLRPRSVSDPRLDMSLEKLLPRSVACIAAETSSQANVRHSSLSLFPLIMTLSRTLSAFPDLQTGLQRTGFPSQDVGISFWLSNPHCRMVLRQLFPAVSFITWPRISGPERPGHLRKPSACSGSYHTLRKLSFHQLTSAKYLQVWVVCPYRLLCMRTSGNRSFLAQSWSCKLCRSLHMQRTGSLHLCSGVYSIARQNQRRLHYIHENRSGEPTLPIPVFPRVADVLLLPLALPLAFADAVGEP